MGDQEAHSDPPTLCGPLVSGTCREGKKPLLTDHTELRCRGSI